MYGKHIIIIHTLKKTSYSMLFHEHENTESSRTSGLLYNKYLVLFVSSCPMLLQWLLVPIAKMHNWYYDLTVILYLANIQDVYLYGYVANWCRITITYIHLLFTEETSRLFNIKYSICLWWTNPVCGKHNKSTTTP